MFLVANWKMNMTRARIDEYLTVLEKSRLGEILSRRGLTAALAPTHVYLDHVSGEVTRRGIPVEVFSQDVSTRIHGAYTGEVGVSNLRDVGVKGTIIGHSERRQFFRETDEDVAIKTGLCLASSLVPVVCFGETLEERRTGVTHEVVKRQVASVVMEIALSRKNGISTPVFLAYEPVWAIGSGSNAQPREIAEVFSFLSDSFSWPEPPRFLYGGSVNLDNVAGLSTLPGLYGFLVGSAWLDPNVFLESAWIAGSGLADGGPPTPS
jgi:triosephosphate isomerase